jgi:Calcineurin-like phosphoesterase
VADVGPVDGSAPRLRIVVVSDLHAYEGEVKPPPSRLRVGASGPNPRQDPVAGVEHLVGEDAGLRKTQLLLCPGDLGHRAQRGGVELGWKVLERLRGALDNAKVVASVGNHDVSSRPGGDNQRVDPTATLRDLRPRYPFDDRAIQQAFFSDHFAIIDGDGWRVVTLNTSAHHAHGEREYDHGRVTPETRQQLVADLEAGGRAGVNVLLMHHHPIEYTAVDEPDRSTIIGGALLMEDLVKAGLGPWLVVHGHKHVPNLAYGPGAGSAPVIFSAGSLTASFHMDQQPITRNQFYGLELDPDAAQAVRTSMACRFRSWYWVPGDGWLPSPRGSGLPAHGGFGARGDPRRFAAAVCDAVRASGAPSLGWADLVQRCPEIEFVIPTDLRAIAADLEWRGWSVELDACDRFEEVGGPWPP